MLLLICSLIGFLLGGFPGLVVGALVGYLLGRAFQLALLRGVQSVQSQFLETTFAVMGALCKADGVVTPDEIRLTQELFVRFRLSPEQKEEAKAAFRRGKSPDFDLDAEVDRFARSTRGRTVLFPLFLQIQLAAVAADGQVHPAEHAMLVRVARRLGLSEADVAQLEALLRAAARGAATNAGAGAGPSAEQRLADAYVVLGLKPEASEAEIKQAYRKLMRDNHPDRLAAKGLPDSMRQVAEERSREINAAFEQIKRARQFA